MEKNKIITIPILPFGLVNAFIIKTARGLILIDSGLPNTEKTVLKCLKKNDLSIEDVKLIIITHAHVDHAGNANLLRKLSNAKILAHSKDLKYYERKELMTFCSTGWFGNVFLKTNLMLEPYEPFTPDILLKDYEEFNLSSFDLDGKVISTPGHTDGSISVVLNNNIALVGDLVSSGILLGGIMCKSKPKSPPFEDDPKQVAKHLLELINTGSKLFYMGHGGPLSSREVSAHARLLMHMKAID